LVLLAASQTAVNGAIVIENWNLTPSSLTFDLSGSGASLPAPSASSENVLYIFPLPGSDWMSSNATGTIVNPPATADGVQVISAVGFNSGSQDHLGLTGASDFDFTDGGMISGSFSFVPDIGGSFNPSAIDVNNVIVAWGLEGGNLSSSRDLGTTTPIPEPSSFFVGGVLLLGTILRRRR